MSRSPVEFGFALPDLAGIGPRAQRIEDLGYDYLAMGEHVAFHGPTPNSFVGLAAAAASTRRINLLSSIVLLPLYPAALAAKLGAALDVVAAGRYTMGVGVGGEYPPEFEACGVPVAERGRRCSEALDVIRQLWQQPSVTYHGRFSHLTDLSIRPGPVQRPSIPIWVSGRSTAAMRRAARYADGWMPYLYTPDMVVESVATVRAAAAEFGRAGEHIRSCLFAFASCHPAATKAREGATAHLSAVYARDCSALVDRYAVAGTPAQCRRRLEEYLAAGVTAVILAPACPSGDVDDMAARLAHEVLPDFGLRPPPARQTDCTASASSLRPETPSF